jgi:hypothetical protein
MLRRPTPVHSQRALLQQLAGAAAGDPQWARGEVQKGAIHTRQ